MLGSSLSTKVPYIHTYIGSHCRAHNFGRPPSHFPLEHAETTTMPNHGRSIYNDKNLFDDVHAGLIAYNDPSNTRKQSDIARSVGISQTSFQRFAEEYSNGNFPASYEAARAQGLGMAGGDVALRLFAEDNIDTDDTGKGTKSLLFRKFVDHFPNLEEGTQARANAIRSVRRIIKGLRKKREERDALVAEAPVDDDEEPEVDVGDFL